MATSNSRGQRIEELSMTDADDIAFVIRANKLRRLKYPDDAEKIRHLSERDFRCWVYGLDPKQALFLTNEKKFRTIQERQVEKGLFLELYDRAWRLFHGLDF